jgi:hypothetical protein
VLTHYAETQSNHAQPSPKQADITSPVILTTPLKRSHKAYTEPQHNKKPFVKFNQGGQQHHLSQSANETASQSLEGSFYLNRTDKSKQTSITIGVLYCGAGAKNTCPSNGDAQGPVLGSKYTLVETGAKERRLIQRELEHTLLQYSRARG